MAVDSVKAKLHEARSALSEMRDEEQKAAGESRYNHRLSAFLSAAQSVDFDASTRTHIPIGESSGMLNTRRKTVSSYSF
jgi:hypothetical protein